MTDEKVQAAVRAKAKRERSPSFPFIPLKTAIGRLETFDEYSKRHPVPAKHAGQAWGMKGDSSQAAQTLAALKAFGLIEYQGSGESLAAILADEGRTYLRAQQDSIKKAVLKRVALKPKTLAKYFSVWGPERPQDAICLDELVLKGGFTEAAAKLFLTVYDDTIAYAGLSDSDKVTSETEDDDLPPTPEIKIGDFVQWNSGGVDQFKSPRKVVGVFPDCIHAQVFGSNTGIPMSELTVVDPPVTPLQPAGGALRPANPMTNSAQVQGENEFSVLQAGRRLQITADVDLEGLQELKEMLGDYEKILARLSKKQQ